jgi:AcrR family transcriptional regulator
MKTVRGRSGSPPSAAAYHHGDLRAALLAAAETELAEKGVQGFTLRGCARRAGVSHAAPAHHFADVTALLTEMAAIGFERLTKAMRERRSRAPADARAQFVASGEGYIAFALQNPQHFALMFGRAGLDRANPRLAAAGRSAFGELLDVVGGVTGVKDPLAERRGRRDVMFAWSFVHGFAKLRVENRLEALTKAGSAEEQEDIAALLERIVPSIERERGH